MTGRFLFMSFILLLTVSITAQDQCESIGWANYDGQTYVGPPTGGGTATPIEVTTFAALKAAAESSGSKVIHIMNSVGNGYVGTTGDVLNLSSNKTFIGYPGVTVKCSWQIKNVSNIIIRNLTLTGPGNSNSNQNWDVVGIYGSKRIWVDHCIVMDGEDGNFDVSKGSDNVSVTWTIFTYSADGSHNFSNLIGGSDTETISIGKLNVTYANCWWKNVRDRCPRTRYGKIHILNCYYSVLDPGFTSSNGTAAGYQANNRVENCHFEKINNPVKLIGPPSEGGCFPLDCKFTSCSGNESGGATGGYTVFTPPYAYTSFMVPAEQVKVLVTDTACGAGPTMDSPSLCGTTTLPTLILTSGSVPQTVLPDSAILELIYTWGGNATDGIISDLPAGLISNKDAGAKSITISGTPSESGTYTVSTVQPEGNSVALSGTITIEEEPSVIFIEGSEIAAQIYPNPAVNSFQIKGFEGNATLRVFDLSGNLLITKEVVADETIEVDALAQGVYIVNIAAENGVIQKKLLKK